MQVGPDDAAPPAVGHRALGPVPGAVARADRAAGRVAQPGQGRGVGAQLGDPAVVLEALQQPLEPGQQGLRDDVADPARPAAGPGLDVEGAQPRHPGAVRGGERGAEDLQARADGEGRGAAVERAAQADGVAQPLAGQDLGGVLAAAEHVDVAARGHGVGPADAEDVPGDPAPAQPGGEHGGVARVAVGAQHLREQQDDRDRLAHVSARAASWKAV